MRPAQTLYSYSRLRRARPRERHAPQSLESLAELLRASAQTQRQVTLRAGGKSFDDQAMNDDVVIDTSAFCRVLAVDAERKEVTVEGGAPWGAIVEATLARGLFPHIVVTTSGATAAGTLSANCMSRSSCVYGHTGDHVRSFSLLTPDGSHLRCSRTENPELFHAVIGGLGYLGVVTQATYDLFELGARRRVRTTIERQEGLRAFTERLTEASLDPGSSHAVYSVYSLASPQRGAVLRSEYTAEPLRGRLHVYQPRAWYRPLAELLFVSSRVSNALCHASYKYVFGRGPFVDDLEDYTFCMEGNERAKAIGDRVGVPIGSIQHSYVVPTECLFPFLDEASRRFRAHDVYPCLLDALYRPKDRFLLSSANELPGFCTSFIFEGVGRSSQARVVQCLLELNDVCSGFGGRLHLVKNVYATRAQLRAMYGHALDEFARLKAKHDPSDVLRNAFLSRAFGVDARRYSAAASPASTPASTDGFSTAPSSSHVVSL